MARLGIRSLLENPAELAHSIQRLLSNRELRDEMGAAGRARLEQHFTSAKMAEGILQVYQETLNQSYEAVPSVEELETQANEVY